MNREEFDVIMVLKGFMLDDNELLPFRGYYGEVTRIYITVHLSRNMTVERFPDRATYNLRTYDEILATPEIFQ